MEDEALRAMVDAMRDLAQAAQGARRRCTELAAASGSFADLVGTLSTIDDVCRVQRACLADAEVVTPARLQERTRPKSAAAATARAAGGARQRSAVGRARVPGRPRASTAGRPSTASATPSSRAAPTAAARKRAAQLEDFREKLPRKYQGEEAMAALLGLRKRVKELSAEGGMSLAQAREHLGAGLPLMQCSQQLDVLCRLGYVVREARNRKDGVRYFAAGPRKRPAGMGGSTRR